MKAASAATLAILSGGQYKRTDLYSITLVTGSTYYFTAGDRTITTTVYPSVTNHTYLQGFTISRGSTTQAAGLDAQELELTISPMWNNPGGVPQIAGYSLIQAARLGLLDNAATTYSKLFMSNPLDATPGAVGWFNGVVSGLELKRFSLIMKVSSDLLVLNQTQMPRALYQPGCVHTVYDAGCTLSKATFTVSGTVGTVTNNGLFNTGLTQASHYFDLGVLTFTSGPNTGYSTTVKSYLNASGVVQLAVPMPALVSTGNTFTIYPGCDHQQGTCNIKFSNLAHFKAMPYTPVPETLYDGGTSNPPNGISPGKQAGNTSRSGASGGIMRR